MRHKILTKVRNNFIAGLLVVLPVVITIWILNVILNAIVGFVPKILPGTIVDVYFETPPWKYLWKVLAVTGILIIIFLIGVFARNVIGRRLISWGEKLLTSIPLVNRIYRALQQIGQAFLGEKRAGFNRVILFQYPRSGLYTLGLVSEIGRAHV